jgi:hypothetical protein
MRNVVQARPGRGRARETCGAAVGLSALRCTGTAYAEREVNEVNVISNGAVPARHTPDPSRVNPRRVSYSASGPLWGSDNHSAADNSP